MRLTIEPTGSEDCRKGYNTVIIEHTNNDADFPTLINLFKRAAIAWGFMPETVEIVQQKINWFQPKDLPTAKLQEELQKLTATEMLDYIEVNKLDIKSPNKDDSRWVLYSPDNEEVGIGATFRDAIANVMDNLG